MKNSKRQQQVLAAQHRFIDAHAAIDTKLDEAFGGIDRKRRAFASKSLRNFIDTYMLGFVLEDRPSPKTYEVIDMLERTLCDSRPVQIQLPRGSGKTTLAAIAILYLIAFGKRKFCVIVSQNARSAANILKDIWRMVIEDSEFSHDFPELCFPFQCANGSFRRKQTYRGVSTGIMKNAATLVFARLQDGKGNELPTSASAITVRGITSGIRGLKLPQPTGRPDCVLIDDILDAESAASYDTNQKLLDIIKKDIMNLSSGKKLAVCMTSTPIFADDLTDVIAKDIQWKTVKFPAIIKYPTDFEQHPDDGLWHEYFRIYDEENCNDEPHEKSLAFYKEHFDEMNEGSEVFQNRFNAADGHISGIQYYLEKLHLIGKPAFQSEMQLQPMKASFQLDITPSKVVAKTNGFREFEVPDGYRTTVCSIDLNTSYCITYAVLAMKIDGTSVVVHYGFHRCQIDQKLTDTAYNAAVYNELKVLCDQIKATGLKIDGVAIDAGGRNWSAVCNFCNNSKHLVGLDCCAFAGRASHLFNPLAKSRLRNPVGRTVLCGDAKEQLKAGGGNKYVFFDADFYKEMAQKALLNEVGSAGSLSLYKSKGHSEFAIQVCNEKLRFVIHKADGRDLYTWTTKEPHDMLDCLSMSYACAAQLGVSAENFNIKDGAVKRVGRVKKKKIVIV